MNTTRPSDEHAPAPEQVGERAGRQQERGERQRVGVDDPLQVRKLECSERWMSGSATFTTVMSSSSMKIATETAISVHHLRSTDLLQLALLSATRSAPL